MSTKNAGTEGQKQSETKSKTTKSSRTDPKKLEKQLRSKYEGKEIALKSNNRMSWGVGLGHGSFYLTHMRDDDGNLGNIRKVPKTISLASLQEIDKAVQRGILGLASSLKDSEKKVITGIEETDLNDESVVEAMEKIDITLRMPLAEFEKELERLRTKENTPKEFFKTLYNEEKAARGREDFLNVLKKYIS